MTENLEKSYFTLDWNLINYTCFCGSAAQRIFFGMIDAPNAILLEIASKLQFLVHDFEILPPNPAQNPDFLFYT